MINVIHIITSPCGGGAEVLVRELVSRMNDNEISTQAAYFNTLSNCAKNINLSSSEHNLNVGFRNPKAIFVFRNYIKFKLKNDGNLIVHVHLTWPMLFIPLSLIGLNLKVIFTEHATSNRRRKYPILRFVERLIYKCFDKIICISKGTKTELDLWLGRDFSSRSIVIHNGARLFQFKKRDIPVENIKFISIGSLHRNKGFDRTIEALARWDRKDWYYTIVGEGPERFNLEKNIIKFGLSANISLIGWSDDIEKHLHESDIQLIPSRYEGFGLVAVEGMSTGLPVIASNIIGLNEVVSQAIGSSFLVDNPDDSENWIRSIDKCLFLMLENIENIAVEAKKNSDNFSLDKMCNNYKLLYKSIYKNY